MHQYALDQTQPPLNDLIGEVEKGNSVEITRSGKRVAILISAKEYDQLRSGQTGFWSALQSFRQQLELESLDIEPEIFEGVRDNFPGREVML